LRRRGDTSPSSCDAKLVGNKRNERLHIGDKPRMRYVHGMPTQKASDIFWKIYFGRHCSCAENHRYNWNANFQCESYFEAYEIVRVVDPGDTVFA
jgi:hypothetical protein